MNATPSGSASPLTVIVVDDEPPARRRLIHLLGAHPDARVVAEAASVAEARCRFQEHEPDLAFIDIQLRGEDAFTLLCSTELRSAVVFVTAHAEHAVRAFECDVVDYLLKPVRPERLDEAIARAQRWRAAYRAQDATPSALRGSLTLYHRGGLRRIAFADILHIVARDDHSELFLRDGQSYLDATRMDSWERRLPPCFLRTHRSHIANLRLMTCVARRPSGWVLELAGVLIPISRSRLDAVRAALRTPPP